ncbi:MAG: ribonuclease HI family protein [Coriobacteriia bacterium]|nr:ribonuclease HI family protein [Coriobacteriia bacterium]
MSEAVLRTDGGSRGNPGPAGAGFVIEVDGAIVCRGGKFIDLATNNQAEYEAFIWGLKNVLALGHDRVSVFADSELLVKQINGQYRVKNPGLKPLFLEALTELRRFSAHRVTHVRREMNVDADEMANQAMDARATVGDAPVEPGAAAGTLF